MKQRENYMFRFYVLLFFIGINNAYPWAKKGHRIIGHIAESYLTPKSRELLKVLIPNESLAKVSNWADFQKSNKEFDSLPYS